MSGSSGVRRRARPRRPWRIGRAGLWAPRKTNNFLRKLGVCSICVLRLAPRQNPQPASVRTASAAAPRRRSIAARRALHARAARIAPQASRLGDALPVSTNAVSRASPRAVDRDVEIVSEFDLARGFAAAEGPRVGRAARRRARPEMAPQLAEKAGFTPGNGTLFARAGRKTATCLRGRPRRAESGLAFAGAARRLEMEPQHIEKTHFAPGNGALGWASFAARWALENIGAPPRVESHRAGKPLRKAREADERRAITASSRPMRRKSRSWR